MPSPPAVIAASQSSNLSLHVFGIPELAKLICDHVSRRDSTSLICVCRQLSQDIRQFAWERTDAVEALMTMIPETYVDTYNDEPFQPYTTMHLPTSLNLSRFNLYAPFIKHLDIPLTTSIDAYENWDCFLAITQSIDLLPNLEHLRLSIPRDTRGESIGAESFNWITAFLSSTLLSFQIYPDIEWDVDIVKLTHVWISLEHAVKLLEDLSNKCHRLSSLMFLPGEVITRTGIVREHPRLGLISEAFPVRAMFLDPILRPDLTLLHLGSLRELSATPLILEANAFRELGQLPQLESLSIRDLNVYQTFQDYCLTLDSDLTEQAFPALRYLDLLGLTYDTIINMCKQRQLAQALRSVRPVTSDLRQNKLSQLLGILADYNSPVSRMYIRQIPEGWRIRSPSLNHLSRLRLTHLSIPEPTPSRYDLSQLLGAIPSLEILEFHPWMVWRDLRLRDLQLFATMLPNLKHLTSSVQLMPSPISALEEQDITPHSSQSLEPFCLELYFYDSLDDWAASMEAASVMADYMEEVNRYLHTLWPNITCKAKRMSGDIHDPLGMDRFNSLISMLNHKG